MFIKKAIIILLCVLVFLSLTAFTVFVDKLSPEQRLGQMLYFDQNLSLNRNQSCSSCHDPGSGFADPQSYLPVSQGSDPNLFGGRNAPSSAYAAFSPFFYWDSNDAMYVGGQFWDGRANTLAEQAAGPFLNPVEMAMPDQWAFVSRLKENDCYVRNFINIYQLNLKKIPRYNPFAKAVPPGVMEIYTKATVAIAEFEKSRIINPFSSKFDYYLAGKADLTVQEQAGLALFNNKAKCAACHISESKTAPDGSLLPPIFSDFTYDNLGIPPNMKIPGAPHPIDKGLGGRSDIAAVDPEGLQIGKFKVVTLRNIEKTAPYGHNGVFETLEQIMHFYNTRDVLGQVKDNLDPGFGSVGWPLPEVDVNVNRMELGDLQLTPMEEEAVVAFLKTLTDGYDQEQGLDPIPVTLPPMP